MYAPDGPHPQARLQRAVDQVWLLFLGAAVCLLAQLWPSMGLAASNDIQTVICGVAKGLQDDAGPIIATIAVAVLGVGAMLGKTSWTLAITTTLGITVLIAADQILDTLFPAYALKYCVGSTPTALTDLNRALCRVAQYLTGSADTIVARVLAMMSISILGASAFFGRLSWGVAMTLALGIGITFGAANIVTNVYTRDTNACTALNFSITNNVRPVTIPNTPGGGTPPGGTPPGGTPPGGTPPGEVDPIITPPPGGTIPIAIPIPCELSGTC